MDQGTSNGLAGRNHIIERPRLTRLLDQATSRIVMLVAPAGYGKTTLAQQWLADKPHAWYRGSTASADVAALAVGLADAAAEVIPGAAARVRERLRATQDPAREVPVLSEIVAEDLRTWPNTAWLAIDDYQFLADEPAAEELLDFMRRTTEIRMLIASRRRPSWATPRTLLYGEVYEIGRAALAMDRTEADAVLARRRTVEVPGLVALAEGWPAVIALAALTEKIPNEDVADALYDYFAEELYMEADPDLQRGL